jgi:hypothetical protein
MVGRFLVIVDRLVPLILACLLGSLAGCGSNEVPQYKGEQKVGDNGGKTQMAKAKEASAAKRDAEIQDQIAKLGLKGGKASGSSASPNRPMPPTGN